MTVALSAGKYTYQDTSLKYIFDALSMHTLLVAPMLSDHIGQPIHLICMQNNMINSLTEKKLYYTDVSGYYGRKIVVINIILPRVSKNNNHTYWTISHRIANRDAVMCNIHTRRTSTG